MMSAENGRMLEVLPHIKQSISDILWTRYGTRVQREEYGSLLPILQDQPMSEALQLRIAASVYMALATWEPRITVTDVTVRRQTEGNTGFAIVINAEINGKAETFILD